MEYRRLNIVLLSAEGLKDMNVMSKMDVYAVASIAGVPASKQKTPVHKDSGVNPKWNHRLEFVVDEVFLTKPGQSLVFQIMAESLLRSDKEIGTVTVSTEELFQANSSQEDKVVDYQVRTPSGKAKGTLKFSYSFGDKFTQEPKTQIHAPPEGYVNKQADQPVTAYPPGYPAAPHPGMGYPPPHYAPHPPHAAAYGAYPTPGMGYGYQAPPPHQPYGYPPAQSAGYAAYPQMAQKPKKKMGMGAGVGLGLGAGLLGGLLVGEMASDIGEAAAYADGYDDAMGDMGGFDF